MIDKNDFPSCARTYATLCIYGKSLNPSDVSTALEIKATRSYVAGENLAQGNTKRLAKTGGWFLSSKEELNSSDLREHLKFLLEKVSDKYPSLQDIKEIESSMVMCYWESQAGNGGPILDPLLMNKLGSLGLELHFDIWFPDKDEETDHE